MLDSNSWMNLKKKRKKEKQGIQGFYDLSFFEFLLLQIDLEYLIKPLELSG